MGLTYDQALDIPLGELMDYVAIEQVKHEYMDPVAVSEQPEDDDPIPDVK